MATSASARVYSEDDDFDDPIQDDDEDVHNTSSGLNPLQARILATEWAENVLKNNEHIVKQQDRPYMLEALIQAGMFERPIRKLGCGMQDNGDIYVVTLKGYKGLMSDRLWGNIFLSKDKNQLLKNVLDTFTQMTDIGLIKVLHIRKIKFNGAGDDDLASGGGSGSVVPSASRRFRRRD